MKKKPKSQILIETSFRLFTELGFKATGIDLIIKESKISKATLYKYFKNKDELILATLKQRHKTSSVDKEISILNHHSDDEPVLGIFDFYHERFQQPNFFGCPFIRAATEFNEKDSIINKFVIQVKNDLENLLVKYLVTPKRSQSEAEETAKSLMILLDGAVMNAQVCHNKNAALDAKKIAVSLLKKN